MNKDGCYTSVHMHHPRTADLFEDVCKDRLPNDDIFVPPQHQPINPEDEDDVVPDQHAAFGIQRATQAVREPAWKDLGLSQLMRKGPRRPAGSGPSNNVNGIGGVGGHSGSGGDAAGSSAGAPNSYGYYAYYYGYNANGIAGNGLGLGAGNGGAGSDLLASPGGAAAAASAAAQRPTGTNQRAYRGMPR
ncbi:hypothetical protein SBRCBS47491_000480 [Sporothrix bragantina]|uniref:Anaphase-promoting complex subunit 13 n=1 Tax=Sporothrix bragantina TaxID=671064 RepID=A0ABP0AQL3_9PEZI